jgi:hypothetical protein
MSHENLGQPGDLFKGEDLFPRQKWVVSTEDLFGHAVGAAEVAAVGDRDPEIMERTVQGVSYHHPFIIRALETVPTLTFVSGIGNLKPRTSMLVTADTEKERWQ